ncbi:MAG TPA: hypothetical protein VGV08_06590 [Casimicrobiaceae bacterium]|nr:hypothetical protein [Casimicrobiaceae bacterium]
MTAYLTISDRGTPAALRPATAIDEEGVSPMTEAQRAALVALVRPQTARRLTRWERRDHAGDVVWAGTLALMLGLSLHVLADGLRFVREADALQANIAARAHVDAQVAQSPSTPPASPPVADAAAVARAPAEGLAEGRQSSGVVRRTM